MPQRKDNHDNDSNVIDRPRIANDNEPKKKTKKPPMYRVTLVNDHYTPFDLVVHVLAKVFRMSMDHATKVMLTAHQKGSCVVALYPKDTAETKANEAMEIAKGFGFPLMFDVEPDGGKGDEGDAD